MKVGTRKTKATGATLTADRVRELAGYVFSEEEIAVAATGRYRSATEDRPFTEDDIIKAARFKARRHREEAERFRKPNPVMKARVSALFKELQGSMAEKTGAFDVRKAETPEQRQKAEAYQLAKLEDLRTRYEASPVKLSDEALAGFKGPQF